MLAIDSIFFGLVRGYGGVFLMRLLWMAEVFCGKAFALFTSVCLSAQWWKSFLGKGLSVMNELGYEAKI
jgi:hypothetical protein